MMKIYGDALSPFVRMCLVLAHEVGLQDRVELVKTHVKPTEANRDMVAYSPAGKIPVLETDHHHAVFDSRVIMEYLAHVAGNAAMFPHEGVAHFRILTLLALAQGGADAAVALRYEVAARPEQYRWPEMIERNRQRVLDAATQLNGEWRASLDEVHAGSIAAACFLAYVDIRHDDLQWRKGRDSLAAWYKGFMARPSVVAWPVSA
jgi:glutathione S-transferase